MPSLGLSTLKPGAEPLEVIDVELAGPRRPRSGVEAHAFRKEPLAERQRDRRTGRMRRRVSLTGHPLDLRPLGTQPFGHLEVPVEACEH